jgi:hypothetical protein
MRPTVTLRQAALSVLAVGILAAATIPMPLFFPDREVRAEPTPIDMTGHQLDFSSGDGGVYNVAVDDSYRFTGVVTVGATTVDAVVTVVEAVNSFGEDENYDQIPTAVYQLDADDGDDTDPFLAVSLFEEYFPDTDDWSYDETRVTLRISFIDQATDDPVILNNLALNVYDIDELQFFEASGVREYAVAETTILAVIPNGTSVRFEEFADVGTGPSAPERSAYTLGRAEVVFLPTSSVEFTFGDRDGGGLYDFDFSSGVSWESNGVDVKADAVDPSAPPALCSEVGTINPGETITCALASGETLSYSAAGGHGGDGGDGSDGQDGGWGYAVDPICDDVPGGDGGAGGAGGSGGLGSAIQGTYTNTTNDPIILVLVAGRNGDDGDDGGSVLQPTMYPLATCPDNESYGGWDGAQPGNAGQDGEAGTSSGVWVVIDGDSTVIAVAEGGAGGTGGRGGDPGTPGLSDGTPGTAGAPGEPGVNGADGGTDPDPLPAGVARIAHPGTPQMLVSVQAAPTSSTPSVPEPSEPVPSSSSTTTPTSVPAPVPVSGELPRLVPGDSQVIENGAPVIVERFVEAGTDLVLRGQDFELRLAGQCSGGCTIDTGESGREVLTLERDGRANVGGEGFLPGTPVYIWLFSEPKFLGELTVNADGTFTGSVSLEGIEVGEHTLQVNGTSFDGVPRSANLGVLVSTAGVPAPDSNHLPATGSDLLWLMTVALALISAGAISVSRRPRPLP